MTLCLHLSPGIFHGFRDCIFFFFLFMQVFQTWFLTLITSKLPLTFRECRCMRFVVLRKRTVYQGALLYFRLHCIILSVKWGQLVTLIIIKCVLVVWLRFWNAAPLYCAVNGLSKDKNQWGSHVWIKSMISWVRIPLMLPPEDVCWIPSCLDVTAEWQSGWTQIWQPPEILSSDLSGHFAK